MRNVDFACISFKALSVCVEVVGINDFYVLSMSEATWKETTVVNLQVICRDEYEILFVGFIFRYLETD